MSRSPSAAPRADVPFSIARPMCLACDRVDVADDHGGHGGDDGGDRKTVERPDLHEWTRRRRRWAPVAPPRAPSVVDVSDRRSCQRWPMAGTTCSPRPRMKSTGLSNGMRWTSTMPMSA